MEIVYDKNKQLIHSKVDAMMMNSYMPLKKLGHKLSKGIYYHTFSSNPLSSEILGCLSEDTVIIYELKLRKWKVWLNFMERPLLKSFYDEFYQIY